MSKYLILILLNIPLLTVGIVSAITEYKAARSISRRKCIALVVFWLLVALALVALEPLYNVLVRANLTDSPPLSLFDMGLLTIIVFCLFFIMKMYSKMAVLNQKISRIHERLAMLDTEDRR
jgi:hypothetical protein